MQENVPREKYYGIWKHYPLFILYEEPARSTKTHPKANSHAIPHMALFSLPANIIQPRS